MQTLRFSAKLTFALMLSSTWSVVMAQSGDYEQNARQILDATGIKGGLIVHIGCGDGRLTAALYANGRFLVQGLDTNAANVAKTRELLDSKGLFGNVSADCFDGRHLPNVGHTVNLVVAGDLGQVTMDKVRRMLAPGAVAYIQRDDVRQKTIKPRSPDMDEWSHFLHDATGQPRRAINSLRKETFTEQHRRGAEKGTGYVREHPATWQEMIPLRIRAMGLASDHLFAVGLPDVVDPKDPLAAFQSRKSALLQVFSTLDGSLLKSYSLTSPPASDGLSAAHGRLYLATANGNLICFGQKEKQS